ncbi:MAG: hypothetical protein NTY06_02775 [Candidatus Gottesmanbacteria bacterium]|nr:hypothetical protein [Candidatus Gottesmanbacteria bacterium]
MDTPFAQPIPNLPKNNSNIFIGILIFIFGIVVGLTLDKTALLSNIRIPNFRATPTPTLLPTPTPPVDPTANWKTYTNSKYVFSFRYPWDWQIEENSDMSEIIISPKTSSENKYYQFQIDILQNSETMTAKEYVDRLLTPSLNGPDVLTFDKRQEIKEQNYLGEELVGIAAPVSWKYDYVYFTKDTRVFFFSFPMGEPNKVVLDPETNYQTARQILSTFRFIEPTTTYICPPSGYVDCMPILTPEKQAACSADAYLIC